MLHTTIGSFDTLQAAAYVGVTNIFLLSLFIYGMAPSSRWSRESGGNLHDDDYRTDNLPARHANMIARTAGGALAGGLVRGSFGHSLTEL